MPKYTHALSPATLLHGILPYLLKITTVIADKERIRCKKCHDGRTQTKLLDTFEV